MPDKHVAFGGSSVVRWINCAGFHNLRKQVPRKPVGKPAIEGTAQHKCMERLLLEPDLSPEKFLGTTVEGVEIRQDHVDALAIALEAYETILEEYPDDSAKIFSEQFVGLNSPDDDEAGGTMDAGIVDGERGAIIDFKFGQMEVEADSEQNLFYAICARRSLPAFARAKEVTSYIIQPAFDPAIDRTTYPASVLDRFEQTVFGAIKAAKAPNPNFVEGDWCDWCDAKLACPSKTQRLATLTAPNHILDLDELGAQVMKIRGWDKWREEAEERLQHELEHGVPVKDWKLVAKRAIRQWIDESAAVAKFKALKIPSAQYMITKLISPAQAEKIMSKVTVGTLANPVSSGVTIAPADDKRPAVLPAAALGQALKKLV